MADLGVHLQGAEVDQEGGATPGTAVAKGGQARLSPTAPAAAREITARVNSLTAKGQCKQVGGQDSGQTAGQRDQDQAVPVRF